MPTMRQVYEGLSDFLLSKASYDDILADDDLEGLRRAIWQAEQAEVFDPDFVYPCYPWDGLDHEKGYALKEHLKAMAGGEEIFCFEDALKLASLVWRFSLLSLGHIKRLVDCAEASSRKHLDNLNTEELSELALLLSFSKKYEGCARICKFAGARADLSSRLRPFIGDMLYLTSYHRYRLTGDRSKPTNHIPKPEEAQAIATRIAGKGSMNALVYDGMTKSLNGDMVGGEQALRDALEIPGSLMAGLRSARHVLPTKLITQTKKLARQRAEIGEPEGADFSQNLRHDGEGEFALFVATEAMYFDKFGTVFLASAGSKNPGVLVHLHLVDFDLTEAAIKTLEKTHNVRINTSRDRFLKTPHLKAYGDYIVNARFIYLAKLLPFYGALFLSDIDGLIHRKLEDYRLLEAPAVLLATRIDLENARSRNAIWGCMSGGIFGITNTPECRLFADTMANIMLRRIATTRKEGGKLFFADQCALAQLYLAYRGELAFRAMSGPFFQQAEDVVGKDRMVNKELWQAERLKDVKAGKAISGFW